jgi:hypothetical protein
VFEVDSTQQPSSAALFREPVFGFDSVQAQQLEKTPRGRRLTLGEMAFANQDVATAGTLS